MSLKLTQMLEFFDNPKSVWKISTFSIYKASLTQVNILQEFGPPPPGKNSDFGNFWHNMGRKFLDFA